jgi:hypothetical protein
MLPDEASSISEEILRPAREESERRRARVESRRLAVSRISTGAAALLGYYLGHKFAQDVSSTPLVQQAIAITVGLLAAAVWPPSPRRP